MTVSLDAWPLSQGIFNTNYTGEMSRDLDPSSQQGQHRNRGDVIFAGPIPRSWKDDLATESQLPNSRKR